MIDLPSTIYIMRLLLSPLLIGCATLIGRRWGPEVSGWFTGFPFISAPISLILAIQSGREYAAEAAVGTLGGQTCVCIFATAYLACSRKYSWGVCSAFSIAIFLSSAFLWKMLSPGLLISLVLLLGVIFLVLRFSRAKAEILTRKPAPWWDLPLRMLIAGAMVYGLTGASQFIGAQWSGILSAFPVFGLILAAFTHIQDGSDAASRLLRGSILGSFGIAVFYSMIATLLPLTGSMLVYVTAAAGSILVNWISLRTLSTKKFAAAK
jgi:hypothetical protein